jgi:hypothetical protein
MPFSFYAAKAIERPDPEVSVPIAAYDVLRALYSS